MKRVLTLILYLASLLNAQQICDLHYAQDMEDILKQFSGFTNKNTLDIYKKYMILVKQHEDLGYAITPLENSFNSEQRARLRTPLQHYIVCRSTFVTTLGLDVFSPPRSTGLSLCEQTYAIELQAALNYYAGIVDSATLQGYQDFMVMLKRYQDIAFRLGAFEKRVPLDVYTKLRIPMVRYNNCKDAFTQSRTPRMRGIRSAL